MSDETFGPVVGIMAVDNDDQALKLMNDSTYGLVSACCINTAKEALRIDCINLDINKISSHLRGLSSAPRSRHRVPQQG
jgi:acyl-CoA reductase-like NAD-dependent aldehyde dehydrogenase